MGMKTTAEKHGSSDSRSKANNPRHVGENQPLRNNNDGDDENISDGDENNSDGDDEETDNDDGKTLFAEPGLSTHKPLMRYLGRISHTFESLQSEIKTQKRHMDDLVHRVQHEQNSTMTRMISAVTRNHNELKSALVGELRETTAAITQNGADQRRQIREVLKETTDTITQGQTEQCRLMRENLDSQTELFNELGAKISDPVKEIHAGFKKLIGRNFKHSKSADYSHD
jgi:hypothetical protein